MPDKRLGSAWDHKLHSLTMDSVQARPRFTPYMWLHMWLRQVVASLQDRNELTSGARNVPLGRCTGCSKLGEFATWLFS